MGDEPCQLHVAFLPLMAPGHTIPMLDMVRLFSSRNNVKTTVITTPLNAPNFTNSLHGVNNFSLEIFPFPSNEVGLPQGIENMEHVTSPEIFNKFIKAVELFQAPLEEFLEKSRPDCLIADMFFAFAIESAAKFGVPRIVFHGTSFFSLSATLVLLKDKEPYISLSTDDEQFVIPDFPHLIRLTRLQLSPDMRENNKDQSQLMKMLEVGFLSDDKCYGTIVNSFYELEPEYADYYRKVLGRRAWHIGPLSLCNRDLKGKSQRGNKTSIDEHECLKWLDSKEPNSVVYVCFGSLSRFSSSQLREIATGLEASGQKFIWVVKKPADINEEEEKDNQSWLPEGFEDRTQDRGLIIRGWAPQVLILEHEAIGGFVTHCGWNSTLEGITAGVPMVTWPVFAEQFFNEKLVTEILKVGIPIGSKEWSMIVEGKVIKHGQIEEALRQVMEGEEAFDMRTRAKKLREMAWKAVEEGGSSHSDLSALLQDLRSYDHHHHP